MDQVLQQRLPVVEHDDETMDQTDDKVQDTRDLEAGSSEPKDHPENRESLLSCEPYLQSHVPAGKIAEEKSDIIRKKERCVFETDNEVTQE